MNDQLNTAKQALNIERLQDLLHLPHETAGFVSVSPRGRENIEGAIEIVDEFILQASNSAAPVAWQSTSECRGRIGEWCYFHQSLHMNGLPEAAPATFVKCKNKQ